MKTFFKQSLSARSCLGLNFLPANNKLLCTVSKCKYWFLSSELYRNSLFNTKDQAFHNKRQLEGFHAKVVIFLRSNSKPLLHTEASHTTSGHFYKCDWSFFSLYYCDRFSFSSFYGFGFHSFNLSAIAEVLAGLYGIQFPVEVQMLLNCRKAANKLLYMLPSIYFRKHKCTY